MCVLVCVRVNFDCWCRACLKWRGTVLLLLLCAVAVNVVWCLCCSFLTHSPLSLDLSHSAIGIFLGTLFILIPRWTVVHVHRCAGVCVCACTVCLCDRVRAILSLFVNRQFVLNHDE